MKILNKDYHNLNEFFNRAYAFTLWKFIRLYRKYRQQFEVLEETFLRQQYWWLLEDATQNKTVIDIGANIGDTAIYSAMFDSVGKVYSFEPEKSLYLKVVGNIKRTPFSSKIKIYNVAADKNFGKHLMGLKNVYIKSDCEGAEHEIFNSTLDLSNVNRIMLEWHYKRGTLRKILERKGFKVRMEKNLEASRILGFEIGFLYA